jgi:hypothetical protein
LPNIRQNYTSNGEKTAFLSIPAGLAAAPQLQKVVRSAYQRPLASACLNASLHKPIKTANIFNLPKYRFDGLASNLI